MRYAADLHLHSRHASGVSPRMTVETIGYEARRKGMDVVGTGDCLQLDWLRELEERLAPAEAGWFALEPEVERRILAGLAAPLRRPLRLVLSTEVNCAPPGSGRLNGLHHLLYFPSFASARRFRREVERHGDLREGRPSLRLTSRQLLEAVAAHGEDCHLAPAHVLNPYFSSLGSQEGHASLEELFGELAPRLLAVETGLTATPLMCRRMSCLDRHALFSCSDAHSPGKIGRECTVLETEPGYGPMFAALRSGSPEAVIATIKVPVVRERYYLNWCGPCAVSFDGRTCPRCGGRLVTGSRDRLEQIADREAPFFPRPAPPFRMLLPLKLLLAGLGKANAGSKAVESLYERLLSRVGHERYILTEAPAEVLARESMPALAKAIIAQREAPAAALASGEPAASAPEAQTQLALPLG